MKIKHLKENSEYFWPVVGAEAIKFPNDKTLPEVLEDIEAGAAPAEGVFTEVIYDDQNKLLKFYDYENTLVKSLDVSAFVNDGMIDSVTVENNNLVFTFNSAAGKQPISIPITNMVNLDNYYTKQELNEIIENVNIETATSQDIDNIIDTIFPLETVS